MRDAYTPRDPDYLRWRAGDHFDPAERWPDWINAIRELTGRGGGGSPGPHRLRADHRLHPLRVRPDAAAERRGRGTGPLAAAAAGVRSGPARHDFWLFDDRLVLFNHFAGDGSSGDKELREQPRVIGLCAAAFEAVWQRAIPHSGYTPA
jgi:hypothetical protein